MQKSIEAFVQKHGLQRLELDARGLDQGQAYQAASDEDRVERVRLETLWLTVAKLREQALAESRSDWRVRAVRKALAMPILRKAAEMAAISHESAFIGKDNGLMKLAANHHIQARANARVGGASEAALVHRIAALRLVRDEETQNRLTRVARSDRIPQSRVRRAKQARRATGDGNPWHRRASRGSALAQTPQCSFRSQQKRLRRSQKRYRAASRRKSTAGPSRQRHTNSAIFSCALRPGREQS